MLLKGKKYPFWVLKDVQDSRQNRSKNKLVRENAVTRVACSKRSDSGERCEVKIAIKSRGGLGRDDTSAWKLLTPAYGLLTGQLFVSVVGGAR